MKYPLLDSIGSPDDLHAFSTTDLLQLCGEIRQRIIDTLSVNGGHLASNLGIVEITVALHKIFHSPDDKFIFDVSHQSYPHKLLTGRHAQFHTIRQFKGLCGFSNPQESSHDHFFAGHAGTALPLALGVAKSRDLNCREEHVIPIIGDATLTCGLTLEALNNIPSDLRRFIVILNDNAMSISKNVGRITHILSRLLSNPASNRLFHDIEALVSKIPTYGKQLAKQSKRLTGSLKNLVSPAVFFEQFGLSYIGPFDGHDLKKLLELFQALKERDIGPVVVHLLTNKGQGMEEAIKNPITYHGVKPFDPETGKFLPAANNKPTFPKVLGKHILKMAEQDPDLVCITPAMSAGSCLDAFMQRFPDRCLDVGIAEAHAVTFSGGICYGKKVHNKNMKIVACVYATFLQRAFDSVFHDVCLQELPVVFAIDRGGMAGPDGHTHNGIYDIAFLNSMPNMVICQPRNGKLLKELLESSFSWHQPTAIRYPNLSTEENDEPLKPRELGIGEVLVKGEEYLIIALGHMCENALKVRNMLAEFDIQATVLDPVFVKPLDTELICELLVNHHKVITIEEHSVECGFGAILNHFLMSNGFTHIQVLNFGVPATFLAQGSHNELSKELGLSPEKIFHKILQHFAVNKPLYTRGER